MEIDAVSPSILSSILIEFIRKTVHSTVIMLFHTVFGESGMINPKATKTKPQII